MTNKAGDTLIALDVGNSRTKWGRFVASRLVESGWLPLEPESATEQLNRWQHQSTATNWSIASVNPSRSDQLLEQARKIGWPEPLVLHDPCELPLRVELEQPEAVGIDRLLSAVAVNGRRPEGQPAVIVDCGSAITVDGLSADGAFLGGAILPGIALAARALDQFTYWLPLVNVTRTPGPVGKSTADAIQSGLFWGTVGAVKELVRQVQRALDPTPVLYLSGGDAPLLASSLELRFELVPDLTLEGIYLATEHVRQRS